jgi:hypothetical protein
MPTSAASSPSVSRPSSSHHRLNKLSVSTVDKLSIVGDKIPAYIPGFKTSAGKYPPDARFVRRESWVRLANQTALQPSSRPSAPTSASPTTPSSHPQSQPQS